MEIFGLIPTFYRCCKIAWATLRQCTIPIVSAQLEEYPKEVRELCLNLARLIDKVQTEFGNEVTIRIWNIASPYALWKMLKFRITKTPTFIINDKKTFEKLPTYEELRGKLIKVGRLLPSSDK